MISSTRPEVTQVLGAGVVARDGFDRVAGVERPGRFDDGRRRLVGRRAPRLAVESVAVAVREGLRRIAGAQVAGVAADAADARRRHAAGCHAASPVGASVATSTGKIGAAWLAWWKFFRSSA